MDAAPRAAGWTVASVVRRSSGKDCHMRETGHASCATAAPAPATTRAAGWRAAAAWLARVPVADPVDRRNAPTLQVVLLLLGLVPPLA